MNVREDLIVGFAVLSFLAQGSCANSHKTACAQEPETGEEAREAPKAKAPDPAALDKMPLPELRRSFLAGVLRGEDVKIANAKADSLARRKDREAIKHLVLATRHHGYCTCMTEGFLWAATRIHGKNLGPEPGDWCEAFDPSWTTEKEIEFFDGYLEGADVRLRCSLLAVLENLGSAAHLLRALDDESGEVKKKAMFHLWQMHQRRALDPDDREAAIRRILKYVDDGDLRHDALSTLGMLRAKEAVGVLIAALKDKDPDIRRTACCYLGGLEAQEAVDPLMELLNDPEKYVRGWAIDALSALDAEKAIEPVRKILTTESSRIPLMEAVHFLHKYHDEASIPWFCKLVIDQRKCCCVRCGSARALGDVKGHPEVVPYLIQALEAEKDNVRQNAHEALKKKTGKRFDRNPKAWWDWWKEEGRGK